MSRMLPKYIDQEAFPVILADAKLSSQLIKVNFDFIFFTGGQNIGKSILQGTKSFKKSNSKASLGSR